MRKVLVVLAVIGVLSLLQSAAMAQDKPVSPAATDKYGGMTDVKGKDGDFFSVQTIGNRWWIVTPAGNGTFIRTVCKVDANPKNLDIGGSGGVLYYDAVCLQPKDGQMSANLKDAADSTVANDVVDAKTGATLKDVGDALYFGTDRFKPCFTYFWLGTPGVGGKVQWYYSAGKDLPAGQAGWKLINGSGSPFSAIVKGADGSYNLDAGGWFAPGADGFVRTGDMSKGANKITWFDAAGAGLPADFAPTALPGDKTPRYYLKAVVTQAFATPPVLNQVYERAMFDEVFERKYGPGDWQLNWGKAISDRLRSWGYNAVGMYSGRYVQNVAAKLGDKRLPDEPTLAMGGAAIKSYQVKNIYSGAVFPPGGSTGWHGTHPDVFDPGFEKAYMELALQQLAQLNQWNWCFIPEEADWLYGFNSPRHDHLSYVVLALNPFRTQDTNAKISYKDPKVYAKYALRDFLRDRYKDAGEKLDALSPDGKTPAYAYAAKPDAAELKALQNLNKAWGTNYTTWGTSEGDLDKGTNAYGKGTGFMDENGSGVLAKGARSAAIATKFTKAEFPAIRKDLDDFMAFFATRYGKIIGKAFAQKPHPPIMMPLYWGPDFVYKAIAPGVDGFWTTIHSPEEAKKVYNAARKPLIIADYLTAAADSPIYFKAKIEKISFESGKTVIVAPGAHYNYRSAWFVEFPDSPELAASAKATGMMLAPRPEAVHWDTFEIKGNYAKYVKAGQTIAFYGPYRQPDEDPPSATQELRAKKMIDLFESMLNLKGDDGKCFVVGFEHWCLYDNAITNWGEMYNFGIATCQDNAYDGVEAMHAPSKDLRGYAIGGEDKDYGNLLGPLGEYLRSIPAKIKK